MHWANKCSQKNEGSTLILESKPSEQKSAEKVNIVLIAEDIDKAEIFVVEASKSVVINTVCTKTIAGEKWPENYKSNLKRRKKKFKSIHPVYHLNLVTGEK